MVLLHAEGWSVASIAEYLQVSKQTVYTMQKRWVQEGAKGLLRQMVGGCFIQIVQWLFMRHCTFGGERLPSAPLLCFRQERIRHAG